MGLSAKLNFAFIAIILVMVLGNAGYSLVSEYLSSKGQAEQKLAKATKLLIDEFKSIADSDKEGCQALLQDPSFTSAYADKNREALSKVIKSFASKSGFSGFVVLIDDKGNVFYNSETPSKFGYSLRGQNSGADFVFLHNDVWMGPAAISAAGTVSITAMVPMRTGSTIGGIVSLNQPVNTELLTGLVTKFSLQESSVSSMDMALVSARDGKVTAVTSDLVSKDGGFLSKVNQEGLKAFPAPPSIFEAGGRLWKTFPLGDPKSVVGLILLTTPMTNIIPKVISVAGQAATAGGVALVIAFIFSAGIGGNVNASLQFLIRRARDLSAQKPNLPPLEGLGGDWLELAELMDTSVSSMRSSIQSLKQQLNKFNFDVDDKVKQTEAAEQQLETLNRQLSAQTKQLSEVSKQVNYANQQAVLLQQKLDSVLQISTEGYLLLDQFGNVLSANPVFLNWMGATEGEIAGRLCFDLVKKPGEDPNIDNSSQVFAKHGDNPADLINLFYPEGFVYHRNQQKATEVLAHLQPVVSEDSKVQSWIMVLRDKSLRSEIAQLKTEIVSMLSDSIRAPLAGCEQTWSSILGNAAQTMHPAVGQSLAQLHSSYEQLLGMVDSLLLVYGGFVPPPVIPREQVVVTRLIADCLEEMSGAARAHQLMLDYKTVTGLPSVNVDKTTLKSIVLQLLEKMISITAPGGRVRAESQVKGNEMRIGITSSGPALAQDEIVDMFAGFIQGKHSEESYSARLSMYLARNNIERLGGKTWAESEAGRGTVIFFTLPLH